jgi:hypothetical protein
LLSAQQKMGLDQGGELSNALVIFQETGIDRQVYRD